MPTDCISYSNSGYFSKLIVDYLENKPEIQSLYNRFPTIENFAAQIEEKAKNYSIENRNVLVNSLKNQYQNCEISDLTQVNIEHLQSENTFTITTGHQLNLFTGPIYFIYKIASTINLCHQLKQKYPKYNFVPLFWMATEDHDFEEINHFLVKEKKISWKKESLGPVGRLTTEGLNEVFDEFSKIIGIGETATYLKNIFRKAYLEHHNLSNATRFLVNELFSKEGVVILDGDDKKLKSLFIPTIKDELTNMSSFKEISKTISQLKEYSIQVNPREINLFYIEDTLRERIIFENNCYKINNTSLQFSESEILELVEKSPEKFSPNVIVRPLYQEAILPNLAYIGGGGEIAYWLQLKNNFNSQNVTFPILVLRNSFVLATKKQLNKIEQLPIDWADLFLPQPNLLNKKTKELSKIEIDFSALKETLKKQFTELTKIAAQTDKSFIGAVKAQEAKQTKGLVNLEKKLLKAEKRVLSEKLDQIITIQNQLFTNNTLQERQINFSECFSSNFINTVVLLSNPLNSYFQIIEF